MNGNRLIAAGTALSLSGILGSLLVWDMVPDPMPIHWNAAGQADGFAGKTFALLFVPIFGAAMAAFTGWLTAHSGRKRGSEKMVLAGGILALAEGAFMVGIHG